ncbi:MAG: peptide-methionine (S)-S-oxide reductase MsrA [Rubripirellula sp.]|nr:peptide-methionine (S)-S-oxide reductase MsrA [Rubripirellula sp.]
MYRLIHRCRAVFVPTVSPFILCAMMASCVLGDKPASETSGDSANKSDEAVATFAGGCFWCTEAVFERMEGVKDVVSGYIGGHVPNPTYEQVCGKKTGHAEAVEIVFDPSKTSYEELLKVFFKTHDPTTQNRQGADVGPQYRSAIFYHGDEQKEQSKKFIEKLNKSREYSRPVVTTLEKATKFYPAEEYHQDYFRLNPYAPYCQAVVKNKVRKFNREFGDKIKKERNK